MTSSHPERATRRASDADREAVVEVLRGAAEDGRLELDEFEQRMGTAYASKTFGDLDPLVADLGPVELPGEAAPRGSPDVRARGPVAEPSELTLSGNGTSTRRTGRWRVPPRVVLSGSMGSSYLDLTEAEITSEEVEFHLDMSMGSVMIIVPPGTEVDGGELRTDFGNLNVRLRRAQEPTTLRVRLTGKCSWGSVTVRGPGFFARRRLRRSRAATPRK